MKVAFGHMRLSSHTFWGFSLREWQAALKGYIEKEYGQQTTPMTKWGLDKLMERYPDAGKAN